MQVFRLIGAIIGTLLVVHGVREGEYLAAAMGLLAVIAFGYNFIRVCSEE